ncbi:hypothetical protein [Niabella drilacis]|uniref:Uncharacterized protein n=1 Tax=Niabella drilacis (strain DSM 25811 / CCM 8410 / CCUG 62505 / LMG 26954 / E90) TaxID=1285928 RepID=A0A1G6VFL9_NIADE|nr:hypothetical protein [Niabella drilacis]SDD52308.1 hypothetical protein SAMN04487894_1102 [Niabella drilacis]
MFHIDIYGEQLGENRGGKGTGLRPERKLRSTTGVDFAKKAPSGGSTTIYTNPETNFVLNFPENPYF